MTADARRQTIDEDGRVAADRLQVFVKTLLAAGGFSTNESEAIAASLILSELMGHSSHGIIRMKQYLDCLKSGGFVSNAELKIVQETPNSIVGDAQLGVGQVVMPKLLKGMLAKASTQAVVSAAICNCGHVGRLGEWVEYLAHAGYPALLLVNDNGAFFFVAPPGGKKAVTSTNPIAFAVPLEDGQIFLSDMSTSAIAFGKVRVAHLARMQLPPESIQNADGQPTTDPEAIFSNPAGTILPMGGAQGYKGFALSMFVDMLVAGLSGGYTPPAPKDASAEGALINNLTLIMWNPKFFAGAKHMKEQAQKYMDFIRASPSIDPTKPIRLAGDRMNALKQERQREGIPVNSELAQYLLKLAEKLGVAPLAELQSV